MQFHLFKRTVTKQYTILVKDREKEDALAYAKISGLAKEDGDIGVAKVIKTEEIYDEVSELVSFSTYTPARYFESYLETVREILECGTLRSNGVKLGKTACKEDVIRMTSSPTDIGDIHNNWEKGYSEDSAAEEIYRKYNED